MRSLQRAFCLICCVSTGCAGSLATQASGWVEVTTEHVRLRTDLEPERATKLAAELQRHRDALVETAFDCGAAQLTQAARITFFANDAAFDAIAPRDAQTLLEPSKPRLAEVTPELLMKPNRNRRILRQAALHEMVHALSADCYPGLPPWLSEGLALFYETAEIDRNALIVGRQKYAIVRQSDMPNEMARTRQEITVVPDTVVPRLVDLLAFEFDEFYRYIDYYDTLQEREKLLLLGHYAGAWALTHALLTVDESINARLRQFMLEVRFGEDTVAEAWRATMSDIDLPLLYDDWTAINVRYPTIAYGHRETPESPPGVRNMSEAEVELHLAARWSWTEDATREKAIAHLERSIELAPEDPSAYVMRAALAESVGARAEAATWLSRAVDLAPDDPAVLRGELLFRISSSTISLSTGRTIAEVAESLEKRAITAAQYDVLARYHLEAEGDTMEARYWAARALRRDPSCASCRVTAGDVLAAAGQPGLAASMYRRALNLAAHDPHFDREQVLRSMKNVQLDAP